MVKTNNIKSQVETKNNFQSRPNNNTMKKEFVFPLITGIVLGVLIMFFWQYTAALRTQSLRMTQIEQVTAQNNKNVNDIVDFINKATNPQGTQTPAAE